MLAMRPPRRWWFLASLLVLLTACSTTTTEEFELEETSTRNARPAFQAAPTTP